jgi:hypothetical protein
MNNDTNIPKAVTVMRVPISNMPVACLSLRGRLLTFPVGIRDKPQESVMGYVLSSRAVLLQDYREHSYWPTVYRTVEDMDKDSEDVSRSIITWLLTQGYCVIPVRGGLYTAELHPRSDASHGFVRDALLNEFADAAAGSKENVERLKLIIELADPEVRAMVAKANEAYVALRNSLLQLPLK